MDRRPPHRTTGAVMPLSEYGKQWMREHYPDDFGTDRMTGVADTPRHGWQSEPPPDDDHHDAEPRLAALLLTRTALKDLPDPQPLIDSVLDQGTNGLLYGPWGTGKTFIALDWAASVATGRPWQGHPTEQRRALYVVA